MRNWLRCHHHNLGWRHRTIARVLTVPPIKQAVRSLPWSVKGLLYDTLGYYCPEDDSCRLHGPITEEQFDQFVEEEGTAGFPIAMKLDQMEMDSRDFGLLEE